MLGYSLPLVRSADFNFASSVSCLDQSIPFLKQHGGLACAVWTPLVDFLLRLHPVSAIQADDLADALIAWAEDEDVTSIDDVFAQPALDAMQAHATAVTQRFAGKEKDCVPRQKTRQTFLRGIAKTTINRAFPSVSLETRREKVK